MDGAYSAYLSIDGHLGCLQHSIRSIMKDAAVCHQYKLLCAQMLETHLGVELLGHGNLMA